jgi:uncharacterized iron-regulated membrane protein
MNKKRHWLILMSMFLAAAALWAAEPSTTPPVQPAVKTAPAAEAGKPGEAPATATKPEDAAAADKPDAARTDPAKADAKPDPAKPDPVKSAAAQAAAKPGEKPAVDDKSSPQRFIPSEQVRADFDVSFPIDI